MHEYELRDIAKQARNVADLIRQPPSRDSSGQPSSESRARPTDASLQSIEGLLVRVAIEIDAYLASARR